MAIFYVLHYRWALHRPSLHRIDQLRATVSNVKWPPLTRFLQCANKCRPWLYKGQWVKLRVMRILDMGAAGLTSLLSPRSGFFLGHSWVSVGRVLSFVSLSTWHNQQARRVSNTRSIAGLWLKGENQVRVGKVSEVRLTHP